MNKEIGKEHFTEQLSKYIDWGRKSSNQLKRTLYWHGKKIKVYALVGKSGTGKSFRAQLIAEKHNIDLIVDDGLLIQNKSILCGTSAKSEDTYIKAIKRALFDDEEHRQTVLHVLKTIRFHKILLLGTSEKMVRKVAGRLNLPPISTLLKIEEISSKAEIQKALASRGNGEHVIPVPVLEIEKEYNNLGQFAIKLFSKNKGRPRKQFEKTVVNPPFQQGTGSLRVSKDALTQMIHHCLDEVESGVSLQKIRYKESGDGYRIDASIQGPLGLDYSKVLFKAHDYIISHIKQYTGIKIYHLDLSLGKVYPKRKR